MNVTYELHTLCYVITPTNEEYITVLKEIFTEYIMREGNIIEFTGMPVTMDSDLLSLHAALSDLGICSIRAIDDGFHIIIGG